MAYRRPSTPSGLRGITPQAPEELLAAGGYDHAFAVLGKPYNTFDPFLNLRLFERLRRMGVLAIPLAYLRMMRGGFGPPMAVPADIYGPQCGPPGKNGSRRSSSRTSAADRTRSPSGTSRNRFAACRTSFSSSTNTRASRSDYPSGGIHRSDRGGRAGRAMARRRTTAARRLHPHEPSTCTSRISQTTPTLSAVCGGSRATGRGPPLPGADIRALGEKYTLGKECHRMP